MSLSWKVFSTIPQSRPHESWLLSPVRPLCQSEAGTSKAQYSHSWLMSTGMFKHHVGDVGCIIGFFDDTIWFSSKQVFNMTRMMRVTLNHSKPRAARIHHHLDYHTHEDHSQKRLQDPTSLTSHTQIPIPQHSHTHTNWSCGFFVWRNCH